MLYCLKKKKRLRCAVIYRLLVQKYISGHTIKHPVSEINARDKFKAHRLKETGFENSLHQALSFVNKE